MSNKKEQSRGDEKGDYCPKFQTPKILLLDLPPAAESLLQQQGLNVLSGTLSKKYRVARQSAFLPLIVTAQTPNYPEQEIIVVDLDPPTVADAPSANDLPPRTEPQWWGHAGAGIIDPRLLVMEHLRRDTRRIHENGGAFIGFVATRQVVGFPYGTEGKYGLDIDDRSEFDSWGLLPEIWGIRTSEDVGREVIVAAKDAASSAK